LQLPNILTAPYFHRIHQLSRFCPSLWWRDNNIRSKNVVQCSR
jgi:hypothetical protein